MKVQEFTYKVMRGCYCCTDEALPYDQAIRVLAKEMYGQPNAPLEMEMVNRVNGSRSMYARYRDGSFRYATNAEPMREASPEDLAYWREKVRQFNALGDTQSIPAIT